jgi:hypothetical protein
VEKRNLNASESPVGRQLPRLVLLLSLLCLLEGARAGDRHATRCHRGSAPLQPCQIEFQSGKAPGWEWSVIWANRQRDRFRNTGSGQVEYWNARTQTWHPVATHWNPAGELCWGELCAEPNFPLD